MTPVKFKILNIPGDGACGYSSLATICALTILNNQNREQMGPLLERISAYYELNPRITYDQLQNLFKTHLTPRDVQQFLAPVIVKWHRDLMLEFENRQLTGPVRLHWAIASYLGRIDQILGLSTYYQVPGQLSSSFRERVENPQFCYMHVNQNHYNIAYRDLSPDAQAFIARNGTTGFFAQKRISGYGEGKTKGRIADLIMQALRSAGHAVQIGATAVATATVQAARVVAAKTATVVKDCQHVLQEFKDNRTIRDINNQMNNLLDRTLERCKVDDATAKAITTLFEKNVKRISDIPARDKDMTEQKFNEYMTQRFEILKETKIALDKILKEAPEATATSRMPDPLTAPFLRLPATTQSPPIPRGNSMAVSAA